MSDSATSNTGLLSSDKQKPESEVTLPVIEFESGIPGFSEAKKFVVVPMEQGLRPFCRMISLDQQGLQFLVVPPPFFFPDYEIEIDEETVERLGFEDASEVVVLLIVDAKLPPENPTVNLLAPIVFNKRTMAAAQIVLHGTDFSPETLLPRPTTGNF